MSLRDEILGYDDLAREPVLIPEWGNKTVYVRIMTGAERDWLDAASLDEQGSPLSVQERLANYRGRLVALTTCQDDGASLFVLSDAEALGKKAAKALDRIVEVAQRLNRMTAEEIDALTKNSVRVPSDGSGSV